MTIYTNLLPVYDSCGDYIDAKTGRYIITKISSVMVHFINIDNGSQGALMQNYFEKEFEAISD